MSEPLTLSPLPEEALSPVVLRAVGPQAPAQIKQMVARGLSPMPPADLAVALYQLARGTDDALRDTALQSAARLPEAILRVALSAPLDARVLDFFARGLSGSRSAVAMLLDNRGLDDRTVEYLASHCEEAELDRIAKDERRMLRSPAIIAALYMNPKARASSAMRAVELAAHNGVTVDIPGFEDVVAALKGVTLSKEDDDRFDQIVGSAAPEEDDDALFADPDKIALEDIERTQSKEEGKAPVEEEAQKKKRFEELPVPLQIRAATLGNAFDRSIAVRSMIKTVCMAAVRSPAIALPEVIKFAANRALNEDVIRYISNRREWTQVNSVRLALINNNKCPLGTSMRLLTFVNNRDLKGISRSRNIPAPLIKAAKELIAKREKRS